MLGLRRRFEQETTYTRVGPVLMAVNPNRVLPEKPGPHVTDVALAAMRGAVDEGRSQAGVISGESGAGKTEAAKYCVQYIVARSSSAGQEAGGAGRSAARGPSIRLYQCEKAACTTSAARGCS